MNSKSYSSIMAEDSISVNFLQRLPLVSKILLYSLISIIQNDHLYIKRSKDTYDDLIYDNYYEEQINLDDDERFEIIGESEFAAIYYQLQISRKNLNTFVHSDSNFLEKSKKAQKLYEDGKEFCIYSMTYGAKMEEYKDVLELIKSTNANIQQCITFGNGLNAKGLNAAIDLMLVQLTNKYIDFIKRPNNSVIYQLLFLTDLDVNYSCLNVLYVLQSVQYADSMQALEDVDTGFKSAMKKQLLCALISIIYCFGILFVGITLIYRKIQFQLIVIEHINDLYLKFYESISKNKANKEELVNLYGA